jgi:hypothetical protein
MAVMLVMELDGLTPEMYEGINAEIGFPPNTPDGLLSHHAGTRDGGIRIVDIWESRGHFDRFIEGTIGPAMAKVPGAADVAIGDPEEAELLNEWHG